MVTFNKTFSSKIVLGLLGLSVLTSCDWLFGDNIPTDDGDKFFEYVPEFHYTYFSNGIDAIKQIVEFDPDAKILVVSAMGQKCYVIEAIEAGAKDFVIKPFDEVRFAEALAHFK